MSQATGTTGRPPLWLRARWPALAAACAIPLLVPSAHTYDLAQSAALYAILAVGYAIVLGLCGQFSVAHAALYGVGAYTAGILTTDPHDDASWVALLAACAMGLLVGALVGLPSLRVGGDQLAVITLFIGGVLQITAQNATSVTGGFGGVVDIPRNALFGHTFTTLRDQYLLAAGVLLVAVLLVERLRSSPLGLAMVAIREDEVAARSAGVRVGVVKVCAFALSGAVAGAAGWLYAGRITEVTPVGFDATLSVLVAVMVLLGGRGRVYGAVIGAGFLGTLEKLLTGYSTVEEGVTGAAIIAVVMWRTGALHAGGARVVRRLRTARA
jgi:branched-chain amino acid transport system permease protein